MPKKTNEKKRVQSIIARQKARQEKVKALTDKAFENGMIFALNQMVEEFGESVLPMVKIVWQNADLNADHYEPTGVESDAEALALILEYVK